MKNNFLDKRILKEHLKVFWFAPCDAYLRAIESAIWKNIKFQKPVLAIGIGDGRYDKLIFSGRKFDVGIDIDCRAVKKAKRYKTYKKVFCQSVERMRFKNFSFKTVVANSTLEHVKNDIKAIREISRVTSKGGSLIFSVPTERLSLFLEKNLKEKKMDWFNKRVSHFHYRSVNDWKKILDKENFKIKEVIAYMDEKAFRVWWRLFRITTFVPYRRELWSYLKDSPYGKLAPKGLIINLLQTYLSRLYRNSISEKGFWVFIIAEKK